MLLSRIQHLFTTRSFRYKLMVTSVACILLPSIITMSVYNYLTQDAVRKQAIYNSQESLMLVDGYVTNLLKSMLSIANYVQQNSDMNAYFKQLVSDQTPEDPYRRFTSESSITSQLENLSNVGEQKSYVTVLLSNGSYFTTYPADDYNAPDFRKEPWFSKVQRIQGFESYWVPTSPTVFVSEKRKNPYQVSVVRALRTDIKIYGVVVVTVMENQVNEIFQSLVHQEDVMLVDGTNRILSSRDTSQIGKTVSLPETSGSGVSSNIVPYLGDSYLVTELPISFTGWKLVSMQPYKTAIVDISSIFTNVFMFQLVSFLIFMLLLLYLLRKFTRPLVHLGRTASAVQRGNLNIRTGITGPDEIGRLGYSFDQMLDRIKEMIAEISLTENRKRRAELAMLQAQINPHFLFNALGSIRMKVMFRGDQESADMIGTLSNLLRMTISKEADEIPLHREIDLVSDYIKLMNMRQKETAELQVEVAAEALLFKVPRFCLQPIIENAMIHGLNRRAGTIRVEARLEERVIKLSVIDSGYGMSEAELQMLRNKVLSYRGAEDGDTEGSDHFSGIGLPNVYERMKMTFGDAFRMDIMSDQCKGTAIVMSIPRKEDAGDV